MIYKCTRIIIICLHSMPIKGNFGWKRKRENERRAMRRRVKRDRFAQNYDGQIDGFSFRESWHNQLKTERPKKKQRNETKFSVTTGTITIKSGKNKTSRLNKKRKY